MAHVVRRKLSKAGSRRASALGARARGAGGGLTGARVWMELAGCGSTCGLGTSGVGSVAVGALGTGAGRESAVRRSSTEMLLSAVGPLVHAGVDLGRTVEPPDFIQVSGRPVARGALREGHPKRRRAPGSVLPVLPALRAVVEMRSASRARRTLQIGLRKAPGTVGGETIDADPFMVPLAVAQITVVRVKRSDEQVLPTGADGTGRVRDERQIAGDRVVSRNLTDRRRQSGVLPAMTGPASVGMFAPRFHDDQMPARRRPSRAASSLGPSFIAR